MAFLDNVRHALGGGTGPELYGKAIQQLAEPGSGQFERAVRSFEAAARKAEAEGNAELSRRAQAHAALYTFFMRGETARLQAAADLLPHLSALERPGDLGSEVPAPELLAEIRGRLIGAHISGASADPAKLHRQAAAEFARCMNHRLVTFAYHHSGDTHVGTGAERHHFHLGMAHRLSAQAELAHDPDEAAKSLGKALASFAACGNSALQEACAADLRRVQTRRACWICQREFPGSGTYFGPLPALVTPFIAARLAAMGEDASSVDVGAGSVVVCTVCHSLVQNEAARMAEEAAERTLAVLRLEMRQQYDDLLTRIRLK